MKPLMAPRKTVVLVACTAMMVFLLVVLTATPLSLSATTVFDSPVRPTHTPQPSHTPRATPTLGAFVSPLDVTPTPTLVPRVWLPLVLRDWPIKYGWKGVADTNEVLSATKANGFWGLNPGWYYNWGYAGPWAAAHGGRAQNATAAALMAAAMNDPAYVPMIWCTDDVGAGMALPTAEAIARDHPGRVWLVFNEPDNNYSGDSCGYYVDHYYSKLGIFYFNGSNWSALGQYIAQQYIRYYDAIRSADPTARLFPFGGTFLPKETGANGPKEIQIWNGFTNYLANPTAEPNRTPRPLDGIAIHAYPNVSAGCGIADSTCLQQALNAAHNFFQGTTTPTPPAPTNANPSLTKGKPIWITEIGHLAGAPTPGSPVGRATVQAYTANVLTNPLMTWFTTNAVPGGSAPYLNSIAWFSTHDCRYKGDGGVGDLTASDLLDIGQLPCPLTPSTQPTTQGLTPSGQIWAVATCAVCACPGPDCP